MDVQKSAFGFEKKHVKNIVSVFSVVFITVALAACGSGDSTDVDDTDQDIQEEVQEDDPLAGVDPDNEADDSEGDIPQEDIDDTDTSPGTEKERIMVLGDSVSAGAERPSYRMALYNSLLQSSCEVDMVGDETMANRLITDPNSVGIDFPSPVLDDYPEGSPEYPSGSTWSILNDDDVDHQAFPGITVDGYFNGWVSENGVQRISTISDSVERHLPDYVLVHLGTNKIFFGLSFITAENVNGWASAWADDMARLVNTILESHPNPESVTVLVANLIPRAAETDPELAELEELMGARLRFFLDVAITELALPNVKLVDVASGFDSDSMSYDGIHPNRSGEVYLAERFHNALRSSGICGAVVDDSIEGEQTTLRPEILTPAPNSQLPRSTIEVTWTANGLTDIERWWVRAGTESSGLESETDFYNSGSLSPEQTSIRVTDLPTDGQTLYISLHSLVNGVWLTEVFEYTAANGG